MPCEERGGEHGKAEGGVAVKSGDEGGVVERRG